MKEDCRELTEKLSAFLDGEAEGKDLDRILAHLEECRCCRHCLDTLRVTREALKKIKPPEMPADMKKRLKACLKKPQVSP